MTEYDILATAGQQLKQVLSSLDYLAEELHPFYPDNSDEPRSTGGGLADQVTPIINDLHVLRHQLRRLTTKVEPFSYDTTTEMLDDLGTFDRSPRD